jgi:hypothetical protein
MSRSNCAQGEGKTKNEEILLKVGNVAMWNPVQVKGLSGSNKCNTQHALTRFGAARDDSFECQERPKITQIGPTLQQQ